MSNPAPHSSGSAAEVTEQAAEWIERRTRASWSDQDEAALQAWLSKAVAHRIAFWRLESAWSETSRLTALRQPTLRQPQRTPPRNVWPFVSKSLAAALVIAAAGYLAFGYFAPRDITFSTELGERKTLTLADGSQIELNTNTTLRTAMSGTTRKVWLEKGEAYFNIKHDPSRPFEVVASGKRILDLGTQFNVFAQGDQLKIAVLQGRVSFEGGLGEAHTELRPGDVAIAEAGKFSLRRVPARDLVDRLSWRSGKIKFHHASLPQVAEEFNRYNGKKVVVSGESARALTINGTFATDDVHAFARIAQTILGLKVNDHGSEIVISR